MVQDNISTAARARLRHLLHSNDISLPETDESLILGHTQWVLEQNKHINLTAITSYDDAIRLHVVDSLFALPDVEEALPGPMLDIGSGGGYPGVPLGIAAHRETRLLDSVQKKMRVLQGFLEEAGLSPSIRAQPGRAEDLAREAAGAYAVVTARAVSALPSLVELARPLVYIGGRFIALKGALEGEELRRGDAAAGIAGFERTGLRRYALPEGGEARTIVIYTAENEPDVALPAARGLPKRNLSHKPAESGKLPTPKLALRLQSRHSPIVGRGANGCERH